MTQENDLSEYIKKGIEEPLSQIPFHGYAPIKRLLMLNEKILPESKCHIAVHFIKDLPEKIPDYSQLHDHDFDEVNMIISENEELLYDIQLGNKTYEVKSPATVYIPKGLKHSAKVVSGKGVFVCVHIKG